MSQTKQPQDAYLAGSALYGDDFTQSEIDAWYRDEAEGYFELTHQDGQTGANHVYPYAELNRRHGFALLPQRTFDHVVGIGAAYGAELRPVIHRSGKITILEPSSGFALDQIDGVPVTYLKPSPTGQMPFGDNSVDLITCFGVLHHIPNVSAVVREFERVLTPGGFALIREPIISLGDWTRPRAGLTKHERGIPLRLLRRFVLDAGLEIKSERKCIFSLTSRLSRMINGCVFNNRLAVIADAVVSAMPFWPTVYHAESSPQKLRATSAFFVVQKVRNFSGAGTVQQR